VKDAHETVQKLCDMHGTLLRILDEKVGLKVFMANEVSSLASLLLDAATKLDRVNRATLAATRSGSATTHSGTDDTCPGEHQEVLDAIQSHNSGEDE
jgi:hypothetical protein